MMITRDMIDFARETATLVALVMIDYPPAQAIERLSPDRILNPLTKTEAIAMLVAREAISTAFYRGHGEGIED